MKTSFGPTFHQLVLTASLEQGDSFPFDARPQVVRQADATVESCFAVDAHLAVEFPFLCKKAQARINDAAKPRRFTFCKNGNAPFYFGNMVMSRHSWHGWNVTNDKDFIYVIFFSGICIGPCFLTWLFYSFWKQISLMGSLYSFFLTAGKTLIWCEKSSSRTHAWKWRQWGFSSWRLLAWYRHRPKDVQLCLMRTSRWLAGSFNNYEHLERYNKNITNHFFLCHATTR